MARRRRKPDELEIVAFERGHFTSYSACGIPYWIGGVVDGPDALVARDPQTFRDKHAIDIRMRHEVVEIDLDDRPAWIYDLNPKGRVPVFEEDGFVLPESLVIMDYLEERHPEPALLPADPADRAVVRLLCFRFDDLGDAYYDLMRGRADAAPLERQLDRLDGLLAERPYLTGPEFGFADAASALAAVCICSRTLSGSPGAGASSMTF